MKEKLVQGSSNVKDMNFSETYLCLGRQLVDILINRDGESFVKLHM